MTTKQLWLDLWGDFYGQRAPRFTRLGRVLVLPVAVVCCFFILLGHILARVIVAEE